MNVNKNRSGVKEKKSSNKAPGKWVHPLPPMCPTCFDYLIPQFPLSLSIEGYDYLCPNCNQAYSQKVVEEYYFKHYADIKKQVEFEQKLRAKRKDKRL